MAWEQVRSTSRERKLLLGSIAALYSTAVFVAAKYVDFRDPYLPLSIAGALFFYARLHSSMRERLFWAVATAAFVGVLRPPLTHWMAVSFGLLAVTGMSALLMMGLRAIWSEGSERKRALAQFGPALLVVFFVFFAQHALGLANLLHPKTYDLYLYVADGALGFQPSFLAGRMMQSVAALRIVTVLVYLCLPLYVGAIYALRLPRDAERPSWDIITMMMLAGFGGWALYNLVPATGPRYFFDTFPVAPLSYKSLSRVFLEPLDVSLAVPRNAIPSLHMAWVLLLLWCSRPLSRGWRAFAVAYTAVTAFATLATGEHYLIDLVASLPFALMVKAIVLPDGKPEMRIRLAGVGTGLSLTLAWMLLVRYGTKVLLVSPVVPLVLIAATAVVVSYLEARLRAPVQTAEAEQIATGAPDVVAAVAEA